MGIPRCVMGDLARLVHHQNGRSKWNGVVQACALVGVPVLCVTGCAPTYVRIIIDSDSNVRVIKERD